MHLGFAILILCGAADVPAGPAPEIPELKVLSHYAGRWDSEGNIKPNPDLPQGAKLQGAAVGEWIHGGRFLRQTWTTKPIGRWPALSGSTLMTFDPRRKTYHSWSFDSTGLMGESEGAWDAATKTMTWTRRGDDGGIAVTRATFPAEDTETWIITVKDGTGKIVSEFSGQNARKGR